MEGAESTQLVKSQEARSSVYGQQNHVQISAAI